MSRVPEWAIVVTVLAGVFAASLTFALALGRSARRADEDVESSPELAEIASSLRPLSAERSPSGQRFFPTPEARSQLAALVYDVVYTRASGRAHGRAARSAASTERATGARFST